jgi:hypothetical protein
VFDDITIVSFIPGRLRLKIGSLDEAAMLAASFHDRIATLPGIDKVEINQATKSILIKYDQNLFATDDSVAALEQALERQLSTEERVQLRSLLQSQDSVEILRRTLAEQLSYHEIERIHAMLFNLAS